MYLSGSMRHHVIDMNKHETINYDWNSIEFTNLIMNYNGEIHFKNNPVQTEKVMETINQKIIDGIKNQIILDAINDYRPSSLVAEVRFILTKYRNLDSKILLVAFESLQKFLSTHNIADVRDYIPYFEECLAYINANIDLINQIDLEIIFDLLNQQKSYQAFDIKETEKQKFGIATDEVTDYRINQTIKLGQFVAPSRLKKISAFLSDEDFALKVAPIYLLASSDEVAYDYLKNYTLTNDFEASAIDAGISRELVKLTSKRM